MKLKDYILSYDEQEAVRAIQAGDEFRAYRYFIGFIYFWARRIITLRVGFEDKLQVGSIGAIKAIRSYKDDFECSCRSWVTTRIRGAILDEKRRFDNLICDLRTGSPEILEYKEGITTMSLAHEEITYLAGKLGQLKKRIVLYGLLGMSNKEIAEKLKRSEHLIGKLKKQAYEKMKELADDRERGFATGVENFTQAKEKKAC